MALFDTASQLTALGVLLVVGVLSRWLSPGHILFLCGGVLLLVGLGAALRLRRPLRAATGSANETMSSPGDGGSNTSIAHVGGTRREHGADP
jgi:uncharacterized membrane protein